MKSEFVDQVRYELSKKWYRTLCVEFENNFVTRFLSSFWSVKVLYDERNSEN